MSKELIIRTDGGARGNPGPAAIGVVIEDNAGRELKTLSRYIGTATNNQAEYQAIYEGLKQALVIGAREVKCYLDSELVVKQLRLEYKVKDKNLAGLFIKVWNLAQAFKNIEFYYVPREKNVRADQLVNQALDEKLNK